MSPRQWSHQARPKRRTYLPTDNEGQPCNCLECQAAEVTHLAIRFVPPDAFSSKARWIHGEELKRWYVARDEAQQQLRDKFGSKLDLKKFNDAILEPGND